jgi:hypothetical protein
LVMGKRQAWHVGLHYARRGGSQRLGAKNALSKVAASSAQSPS